MKNKMGAAYGISLSPQETVFFNGEEQKVRLVGTERRFDLNKEGVMEIKVEGGTSIWYFVKPSPKYSVCTCYSFETEIEKLAYIAKYCHAKKVI